MKIKAVQQHAIDRYKERTGCSKDMRSANRLWSRAEHSIPIGRNRFYSQGWITVVVKGVIKTTYKPKTQEQFRAIYEAKERLRNSTPPQTKRYEQRNR